MRIRLAILLFVLPLAACSKDRKAREWSAKDHAQPQEPPATTAKALSGIDGVYQSTCQGCHGAEGQGDGPMGRSLRVSDLSSAAWQERVSDQDIAKVITEGRGKMPSFKMPPAQVDGLVKKIRSFRK